MQEQTRRRVGLMGGTFDPIHIGHLMLAECAYEQFQLEQVLFLPAGNPPHKDKRKVGATDAQRIDMVRLAIEGNAVAVRDQMGLEKIQAKMHELEERFQARIYLLQTPDIDIASSHLRQMRSQKRSIRYYVTDPVWQYIEEQALYL